MIAKACMEIPQHRRLVGCDIDAHFFAARTEVLGETYARQVLNERSNISGTNEVVSAYNAVARVLNWLQSKKRMRS